MAYTKNTWASGDVVTAEKLNHIEDGIESAATAELPAVSDTDNGDVLTVVDGVWGKAAPSGGGVDMVVVYVTAAPADVGYTFATETAYADILAEIEAGKVVIYWATFDNDESVNIEMSVSVGYSKSGDTIFLTLGNGMGLIHTAEGIVEES